MSDWTTYCRNLQVLLISGSSLIAFAASYGPSFAQMAEIDSYDLAVRSQSKANALAFIEAYRSSHLVGDLIESLSPEVAQQVCAELGADGPARARKACESTRGALAVAPVEPAAGSLTSPVFTGPAATPADAIAASVPASVTTTAVVVGPSDEETETSLAGTTKAGDNASESTAGRSGDRFGGGDTGTGGGGDDADTGSDTSTGGGSDADTDGDSTGDGGSDDDAGGGLFGGGGLLGGGGLFGGDGPLGGGGQFGGGGPQGGGLFGGN